MHPSNPPTDFKVDRLSLEELQAGPPRRTLQGPRDRHDWAALRDMYSVALTEHMPVYRVSWKGWSSPRGVLIPSSQGDWSICLFNMGTVWAKHVSAEAAKVPLGTYERVLDNGGESHNEHEVLIFVWSTKA